ncbi:MAG: hypothetical protein ABH983_05920, partial [Candidatus Micrarchaeota archaeon]
MGGYEIPVIGFDETVYRQEFAAVLAKGTAKLVGNAQDPKAFLIAYDQMDSELAVLTDAHCPPISVANSLKKEFQRVVQSIITSYDVDLQSVYGNRIRKVCSLVLGNLRSDDIVRIDKVQEQALEALAQEGYSSKNARRLLAELTNMNADTIHDMIQKMGNSKDMVFVPFLNVLEKKGSIKVKNEAANAKAEILSTISPPPS